MNSYIRQWFIFLFGTPKRSLWTFGILLAVALSFNPDMGKTAVSNLVRALWPVVETGVVLLVIVIGLRVVLRGFGGSAKKK